MKATRLFLALTLCTCTQSIIGTESTQFDTGAKASTVLELAESYIPTLLANTAEFLKQRIELVRTEEKLEDARSNNRFQFAPDFKELLTKIFEKFPVKPAAPIQSDELTLKDIDEIKKQIEALKELSTQQDFYELTEEILVRALYDTQANINDATNFLTRTIKKYPQIKTILDKDGYTFYHRAMVFTETPITEYQIKKDMTDKDLWEKNREQLSGALKNLPTTQKRAQSLAQLLKHTQANPVPQYENEIIQKLTGKKLSGELTVEQLVQEVNNAFRYDATKVHRFSQALKQIAN